MAYAMTYLWMTHSYLNFFDILPAHELPEFYDKSIKYIL